jgi:hypothetical protein
MSDEHITSKAPIHLPRPEEDEDQADNDLVTVAAYRFANEAELARMHLAEAGIEAVLADAETVNMDWLLGAAVGDIKVQVMRSQAATAEAILQNMRQPLPDEAEEATESKCLSCGAELPEGASSCAACGWTYEGAEETPDA